MKASRTGTLSGQLRIMLPNQLGTLKITVKTEVMANNYFRIARFLREDMEAGFEDIAGELLNEAREGYESGRPSAQTGAAAASFYVISPYEADITSQHAQALSRAKALYVGQHKTRGGIPFTYDAEHFEGRALVEPVVKSGAGERVILAGIATPLKYVGWWNSGHFNYLTGKIEFYPLLDRLRDQARSRVVSLAHKVARQNSTPKSKAKSKSRARKK